MEYYGNNDWRDYLALKHYGVKGMKWGKRKKRISTDGNGVILRKDINGKYIPVSSSTGKPMRKDTVPLKKKSSGRPLARKKRIDTDGKGVSLTGQYYREHLSGKDRINQIFKNMKKKKKTFKGKLTKRTFGSSK